MVEARTLLPLLALAAALLLGYTAYVAFPAFSKHSIKVSLELEQLLTHQHHAQESHPLHVVTPDEENAGLGALFPGAGLTKVPGLTVAELLSRTKSAAAAKDGDGAPDTTAAIVAAGGMPGGGGDMPGGGDDAIASPGTLADLQKFGDPWVSLPLQIATPPAESSLKPDQLLGIEQFMGEKTLKPVDQLTEVPPAWKATTPVLTKLQVPYWIVRDNSSAGVQAVEKDWADALHYDTPGATYGKCAGNAKLVDLAKAGAWKRGVREEIDVEEWPFKPDLFKEAYVLQVPWGFLGDNHVFGTSAPNGDRLHFGMSRFWMTNKLGHIKGCYKPNDRRGKDLTGQWARVDDLGEIAISAESWQGDHFQHFVLDTLPRLSLVYDALVSKSLPANQSHLGRAKIIYNDGPSTRWFMKALGFPQDRLVNGISWCIKSDHLFRARLALYPEYHNVPMASDPRPDARHGVHPRGALAPIQRALGVWADPRQDTVVYVKRRGARSLRCDIEEAIIEGIRARLARTGVALEVQELKYTGKQEDSLALMRRAMMVFGVHGGGLANAVFAKPGTAFIEIMPIRIMHLLKHRTSKYCYYGLAQAAGLDYYTVEPPFFGWGTPGINPDPRDVLDILEIVLKARGYK